jgi:hypothetical protein
MKAFQDRRAARQDCQKAGAPAESALSNALSKPDTFPFGAFVEHDVLPCADRESLRSFSLFRRTEAEAPTKAMSSRGVIRRCFVEEECVYKVIDNLN